MLWRISWELQRFGWMIMLNTHTISSERVQTRSTLDRSKKWKIFERVWIASPSRGISKMCIRRTRYVVFEREAREFEWPYSVMLSRDFKCTSHSCHLCHSSQETQMHTRILRKLEHQRSMDWSNVYCIYGISRIGSIYGLPRRSVFESIPSISNVGENIKSNVGENIIFLFLLRECRLYHFFISLEYYYYENTTTRIQRDFQSYHFIYISQKKRNLIVANIITGTYHRTFD